MEKHIPEGYKQTEVGIFPEDWVEKRIGDIFDFKNGLNKGKEYFGYGIPIINYMDVYKNSSILGKNLKGRVSLNKNEIETYKVNKGDVFFTRTSETVEEIGMSAVLLEDSSDTVFSGFLLRARPRNQILDLEFCKYCFSHKQIRRQILQKASFTTRALTNGKLLSRVILLIPPTKTEQQSIATALSDVDNLITSLEQLIEKKKAIKQGTMQELLTGKRRLKGFGEGKGYKQTELGLIPEDWEVKRLHELGKFQSGIGFPLHLQGKHQEVIPFYKVSDMNNNGNEVFMLNSNNYISQKVLIELGATLIPRSSIVFAKIGAALFLERKRLLLVDSLIDNNMMAIIADIDTIDTKYLYYLLINIKLSKYANTTALPSINRNDIGEINLKIPTLYEQQAITEVLTNMDSEIENLETKVNKYKQIKQGMMQNLLTGRIRLA